MPDPFGSVTSELSDLNCFTVTLLLRSLLLSAFVHTEIAALVSSSRIDIVLIVGQICAMTHVAKMPVNWCVAYTRRAPAYVAEYSNSSVSAIDLLFR